ncbi:MAG: type III-B CRISPR module-associated protein Cmr5 [Bdellovibrionales bacterium]
MTVWLLDKERAKEAWDRVRQVKSVSVAEQDPDKAKEWQKKIEKRYRSIVRGSTAMIQRNGLGQFLAFLASKGFSGGKRVENKREKADALLYQHVGHWLIIGMKLQDNPPNSNDIQPGATNDPLEYLLAKNRALEEIMWATNEALAYLQWSKRFVESQLEEPDEED